MMAITPPKSIAYHKNSPGFIEYYAVVSMAYGKLGGKLSSKIVRRDAETNRGLAQKYDVSQCRDAVCEEGFI
jgi:hypothetical protein